MLTNLNDIVVHLLVLYDECVFSTYCILHFCILALHQLNCTYGLICDIHGKPNIDLLATYHYIIQYILHQDYACFVPK